MFITNIAADRAAVVTDSNNENCSMSFDAVADLRLGQDIARRLPAKRDRRHRDSRLAVNV